MQLNIIIKSKGVFKIKEALNLAVLIFIKIKKNNVNSNFTNSNYSLKLLKSNIKKL